MCLILYCLIIVATLVTPNSFVIYNRCDSWYQDIIDEASFYCYETETRECSWKSFNFTVEHIPGEEQASVSFNYEPNCEYELKLKEYLHVKDQQQCYYLPDDKKTLIHSKYVYKGINDSSLPLCTKKGIIKLKYLYEGCFAISLSKKHTYTENIKKKYFLVHNNKTTFNDSINSSTFIMQSSPEFSKIVVEIKHPFVEKCPNIEFPIKQNSQLIHELKTIPDATNCSKIVKYKTCNYNNSLLKVNCSKESDVFYCELRGLDTGSYEIGFIFRNLIQCPRNPMTVWHEPFGLRSLIELPKYDVSELTLPIESSVPFTSVWIILAIASIGVPILVLLSIYVYRVKRMPKESETIERNESHNLECLVGQRRILLLYAKDAPIVMKTLEAFRNILFAAGFEVFDVYDENQQIDINRKNHKWMIEKLADEHTKIILVQTYCGLILSNQADAETMYKKPTCYDNYFLYALSMIRSDLAKYNYARLFVVSLGFKAMKFNTFPYPVTRIYGLPDNFKILIRDLHGETEFTEHISDKEINNFTCLYNEMKEFIEDSNYLSDILKVSISSDDSRSSIYSDNFNSSANTLLII